MTIDIRLSTTEFEQDIRALIMAFYPGISIKVQLLTEEVQPEVSKYRSLLIEAAGNQTNIQLFREGVLFEENHIIDEAFENPLERTAMGEHDSAHRLERKNQLKRVLYHMFVKDTGKQLPWGTLTGIRPTKLPMAMLEQGKSQEEITTHMETEYYTSREKINLATEIALREQALLEQLDYQNGYSLYVGIPFCPSTCAYCSFTSYPLAKWEKRVDEYLDTVEKELDFLQNHLQGKKLDTLYIGGGTPTTLNPKQLDRLCTMLEQRFPVEGALEWTVEAGRPDSLTREKLKVLREHPVTRISINPQTMKEETLRLIGRKHTVQETIDAYHLAREMGFDNINMDIILGLPDETQEDVEHTLEEIAKLSPDSLTVHSLAIKRAARLNTEKEAFKDKKIINNEELHMLTEKKAREMGLLPYYLYRQKNMAGNLENVGYAKDGKYGIYNILIMEEMQSIYAAGAGASSKLVFSKDRHERVENVKAVEQYIARIDEMIERKKAVLLENQK